MSIEKLLRQAEEKKRAQEKPKLEIVLTSEATQPTQLTKPTQPIERTELIQPNPTNPTKPRTSIAPEKDFSKVPNSLARHAVPERLFKGMSKNTYDALYLKTRGAINPVRRIRATKSDLLRWTGISDVTLDKHVRHLKSVGLLRVELVIGSHEGNWYEVFIPEELPNQPNVTNLTNPTQDNQPKKVGGETPNLVGKVGWGQTPVNIEQNESSKTSYKTNTSDDDSPLSFVVNKLDEAAQKITGKGITKNDLKALADLVDVLTDETAIAAARTKSVSAFVPFMVENLRRRLYSKSRKETQYQKDTVGKTSKRFTATPQIDEQEDFIAEPLSIEARQNVLEALRDQKAKGNSEFINSLMGTYTREDWTWLMEQMVKD